MALAAAARRDQSASRSPRRARNAARRQRLHRRRAPATRRRRRRARRRSPAGGPGSAPCGRRRCPTGRRAGRARCSRAPSPRRSAAENGRPRLDLGQHEAERAREAALDLEDAVARLDQLAVGVEDRQPGARRSPRCSRRRPALAASAASASLSARGPESGRLLASTTSIPAPSACRMSGVLSSAVTSTRIGSPSACSASAASASAGARRRPPGTVGDRLARLLGRRQRGDRARGEAVRIEHEAARSMAATRRSWTRPFAAASRPGRRAGPLPLGHDLGQRAADLAEAEQHDVGVRGARRPRRRRSSRAGRPRAPRAGRRPRPWPPTTNEMFSSDEPCAMATMLISASASAEKTRAAIPGCPAMPRPDHRHRRQARLRPRRRRSRRARSGRGTPRVRRSRARRAAALGHREADRLLRRRLRDERDADPLAVQRLEGARRDPGHAQHAVARRR